MPSAASKRKKQAQRSGGNKGEAGNSGEASNSNVDDVADQLASTDLLDASRPFRGSFQDNELPLPQIPVLNEVHATPFKNGPDHLIQPSSNILNHPKIFVAPPQGSSESDRFVARPGFAKIDSNLTVMTNHFDMSFDANTTLYEYEILGIDPKHTRPKKRVLVETVIDTCKMLSANRDSFATDFQKKVVAWKDLSLWNGQKVAAQQDEVIAEINIVDHKRGGERATLKLQVKFLRIVPLRNLQEYAAGRRNDSTGMDNIIEALNLVLAKPAITGDAAPAVQAGKDRVFPKFGYHTLSQPTNKFIFHSYTVNSKATMGHVLLNLNVGASAFHKAMLVSEYLDSENSGIGRAQEDLQGVRVWINFSRTTDTNATSIDDPPRRTKTIAGFPEAGKNAGTLIISMNDGKGGTVNKSVFEHFSDTYGTASSAGSGGGGAACGMRARPNSHLVNCGSKDKPTWYCADDLIILPYQIYKHKLDPTLTSKMIQVAARHPQVNKLALVQEGLPLLGIIEGNASRPASLTNSGIAVDARMLSIPAHTLTAPKVLYEGKSSMLARNGGWSLSAGSGRFVSTSSIFKGHPFLLYPANYTAQRMLPPDYLSKILNEFSKLCKPVGLSGLGEFQAATSCSIQDWSVEGLRRKAVSASETGADLLVLLLPKKDSHNLSRYANFKIVADQLLGMKSLCLSEEKMRSSLGVRVSQAVNTALRQGGPLPDPSNLVAPPSPFGGYARNVAMKLNIRLGNINHDVADPVVAKFEKDTMVLGADVTHSGVGSAPFTPSIAAVVGSVDRHFGRAFGSMRLLPEKTEIINSNDMKAMVLCRLRAWARHNNGRVPGNIIYYRDGVGDSQFVNVRNVEVRAIAAAWREASRRQDGAPKITAIIVSKRHNTRLFPQVSSQDVNSTNTKTGNCQPGTAVDVAITSPYFFDFFLLSHNSLKGTGRPAHYFVLENGMNFKALELQQFTNSLCYLFARSTTAVSYATPAYYADRLCERGRMYIKDMLDGHQRFGGYSQDRMMEEARRAWARGGNGNNGDPWHPNLNETMFWM